MKSANSNLHKAKSAKNDEFYTQLTDIEKELFEYRHQFEGKNVLCNCDDPEWSAFWQYFEMNFEFLKLAKVTATHYAPEGGAYMKSISLVDGKRSETTTPLVGDGDFRSDECIALLRESDIVVTNPPFSLFREFIATLVEHDKKFLVIGSKNAITYKETFKLIKDNRLWLGWNFGKGTMYFTHNGELASVASYWYTNMDTAKRHRPMLLGMRYGIDMDYKKYDNYDAIEVSKLSEIPCDYYGVMGVPITIMDKLCPEQFEIIGATESEGKGFSNGLWDESSKIAQAVVNGQRVFKRIFIKRVGV